MKHPFNRKFNVAWILSAIAMYVASITWHAVILNDFSNIKIGNTLFYYELAVGYLILGFILTYANFTFRKMLNSSKYAPLIGVTVGLLIYLVTMIVGINFNTGFTAETFAFDATWQMIEQGIGGSIFYFVMRFMRKSSFYLSSN